MADIKLFELLEIIKELVAYNCAQCNKRSTEPNVCIKCPVFKNKVKAQDIVYDTSIKEKAE